MKKQVTLTSGSKATIFMPLTKMAPRYILYFHGGGLIFGSKADLTENLAKSFCNGVIQLLALTIY